MKVSSDNPKLPSDFVALHFLCTCFGVGEKELMASLDRLRRVAKNPDAHFPKALFREMFARAGKGQGRWLEALSTIHREALYERLCRKNGEPLFSFSGKFAEETIFSLLTLYERLRPKLNCKDVPVNDVMWLLIEDVFVPTLFIKLVQEWRFGLGTEWLSSDCWYLPVKSGGEIQKPISRVLDCWLRVAGFRTAYGVSQSLTRGKSQKSAYEDQAERRWKTWKKSVERWRKGKPVQSAEKLHRLVETFPSEVAWLDKPDSWKARFTLAFGMQKLCNEMDEAFRSVSEQPSLAPAKLFRQIADEHLACDDAKCLAGAHTFFASRLIQLEMRANGEWDRVVANIPKKSGRTFAADASDDEISRYRDEIHWQYNPGNWLLERLKQRAVAAGRLKANSPSAAGYIALESHLFDLGVEALNKVLNSERKEAGKR